MEITVPVAANRDLQIIEYLIVNHTGREYNVQWDTNGMNIVIRSDVQDKKPTFMADVRPGRVEVTEVDPQDNSRRLAPSVILAEDTKDIKDVKFRHLVEKALAAVLEKRDGAKTSQVTETDISTLL